MLVKIKVNGELRSADVPPETTLLISEPSVMNYNQRQFQLKINTTVESGTSNLEIIIN